MKGEIKYDNRKILVYLPTAVIFLPVFHSAPEHLTTFAGDGHLGHLRLDWSYCAKKHEHVGTGTVQSAEYGVVERRRPP